MAEELVSDLLLKASSKSCEQGNLTASTASFAPKLNAPLPRNRTAERSYQINTN
jgi:hypothetical protein